MHLSPVLQMMHRAMLICCRMMQVAMMDVMQGAKLTRQLQLLQKDRDQKWGS